MYHLVFYLFLKRPLYLFNQCIRDLFQHPLDLTFYKNQPPPIVVSPDLLNYDCFKNRSHLM